MAKKKIAIEDKPEEVEANTTPPVEEATAEESTTLEAPEASEETTNEPTTAGGPTDQPSEETAEAESQNGVADTPQETPIDNPGNTLPKRPRTIKRNQLIVIVVLLVAITGGLYLLLKPNNPLPKTDTKLAKFTVYYPKSNGSGFSYASGSASFTAGELTYSLEPKNSHVGAGGPIIRVNEAAIKGSGPDLNSLTDFTLMKVPAGNAAIGNNGEVLNGVIETKKTLIILNGLDGASKQQLLDVMKAM